jgi:hypothetical protein
VMHISLNGGRVSISLEREPDASLAAAVEGDMHHTIIARDGSTGRLIAMGGVSVRDRYINGKPTRVGYLGQLRLDHAQRPRASIILGGYALFRDLHDSLGVQLYLTSIASDNIPARRLLERGLPGMPTYLRLDSYVTSLIQPGGSLFQNVSCATARLSNRDFSDSTTRPDKRAVTHPTDLASKLRIEAAGRDCLPDILGCLQRNGRRYQCCPVWRKSDLIDRMRAGEIRFFVARHRDHVIGCVSLWDQSAYKQAVIRGYERRLIRWRAFVNLARRCAGQPALPPLGAALDFAYVSHVAVDGDDQNVFAALLTHVCNGDCGGGYLVLGLSGHDPLMNAIPKKLRRQTYETHLYAVHWDDGRTAAEGLDGRACHPEVALL